MERTPDGQSGTSVWIWDWAMGASRWLAPTPVKSNSMGSSSVRTWRPAAAPERPVRMTAARRVDLPEPMTPETQTRPEAG